MADHDWAEALASLEEYDMTGEYYRADDVMAAFEEALRTGRPMRESKMYIDPQVKRRAETRKRGA